MIRVALALLVSVSALAQRVELLWPEGAPGAAGAEDRDKPSITIYLPAAETSSGAGVVICPGGGYGNLSMEKEGSHIADWLNARGIAGFVLKYRLGPRYHHPAPLDDAQRALRYVRTHAPELHIQPDRVGIWGFSAGGQPLPERPTALFAPMPHHAGMDGGRPLVLYGESPGAR